MRGSALLVAFLPAFLCDKFPSPVRFSVNDGNNLLTLENGYSKVVVDLQRGQISELSADFAGNGQFGSNILSLPFGLSVNYDKAQTCSGVNLTSSWKWLENTDEVKTLQLVDVVDCPDSPIVSENWTISLSANDRSLRVSVAGAILKSSSVNTISHGLYLNTPSLFALFDRGVAQMMSQRGSCLGSSEALTRAYFLGGGGALDFLRGSGTAKVVFHSQSGLRQKQQYFSGVENVLIGDYPNLSLRLATAWSPCWDEVKAVPVSAGQQWTASYELIPNNFDFPVYSLSRDAAASVAALPFTDTRTYLTGIYASPAGCLQSYYEDQWGIVAPTISHPDVGYSPDTNFFDPDNFLTMSALLDSGDDYFLSQVKNVLQRTADTMCGIGSEAVASYCDVSRQRLNHLPPHVERFHGPATSNSNLKKELLDATGFPSTLGSLTAQQKAELKSKHTRVGQLMHHFISLVPTYESIAGSEQLGPNIFWTMTVLRYISITQDRDFAEKIFPYVDLSTRYLLTFIDSSNSLVDAPGPLWIDVIVRENYTSDSPGALVPVLQQLAEFYDYMDQDADFASYLRETSSAIAEAMNRYLWSSVPGNDDHYITQLNPDGTIRDFVDYDSNLLTVAFGIAPPERQAALLKRVDGGEHTHIRATWCSEIPYSGDACDCYIVGGSVCGDSVVTLARIGWVDALARKRIGDLSTFDNLLLSPLQTDLTQDTWLYERYDANGTQIRTPFYFEYPALVTMMLREVRYGLNVTLNTVTLSPFPVQPFQFSVGHVDIRYSSTAVSLRLPGPTSNTRSKLVTIHGLVPSTEFTLSFSDSVKATAHRDASVWSDTAGSVSFSAVFTSDSSVKLTAVM